MFTLAVHRLLSPIGGRHKAIKAGQVEEEIHQANAAGPNCDADQRAGKHESVEERQARPPLQEVGDVGTRRQGVMPPTPGWQSRSRHLEFLGGLALGNALSAQCPLRGKEGGAFASIPAWLAPRVDWWPLLDDGSHRDLLIHPSPVSHQD